MRLDRLARHAKRMADFLVRQPTGHQTDHLCLARRQFGRLRLIATLDDQSSSRSGTHRFVGVSPTSQGLSVRSRDWLYSPSSTSQRGETECT